MKKFLGTLSFVVLMSLGFGQNITPIFKGKITDLNSKVPIEGATVTLGDRIGLTNGSGEFNFTQVRNGSYTFTVTSLGYGVYRQKIIVSPTENMLQIGLTPRALFLEPLEVKAIRASDKAPFTRTNLDKASIVRNNLGQDIPFLLNQTPSVVIHSDAGNGVGYTGIRIRGSDATRINVTLNGIPYNDAESMGTFFVDLPDFASSLSSIQIQRGVGTSSNGPGAFGASINLATNEYQEKSYAELNNSVGSFNTWKNTIKAGTGLLKGHFTIDGRLSRITSNGFIDRARSELSSFYVSTAWLNKTSSLRLNVFSGKEKTYQSWYGVPENLLMTNRTYNPAGTEKNGNPYENQTDNYTQTHYQLFFNQALSALWSFQTAAFLTRGKGYYEEYKADQLFSDYGLPNPTTGGTTVTNTDLVRQRWLDNYFYGQLFSFQYKQKQDELTLGGGWSSYDGKHYGTIPWIQTGTVPAGYRYYDYPAKKTEAHAYAKWQHRLSNRWTGFTDIQFRHVNHTMNGFQGNGSLVVNRNFNFLNPKAGITYSNKSWQAYLSYALAHKEPNRDDFQAGKLRQPLHETLHNLELGAEKKSSKYQFGANLYYMYYLNQLVLTGQINDVGAYTRSNIPNSYRLGLELQGSVIVNSWMQLAGNLSMSRNKIRSFTEYVDNYDTGNQDAVIRNNTNIAFSPAIIGGASLQIKPIPYVEIAWMSKYVAQQYLDNSQQESRSLPAFFVQDIRAVWSPSYKRFKQIQVIGQINNLFNQQYEPNGYTYSYTSSGVTSTDNGYYPMAGTHFMLGINLTF